MWVRPLVESDPSCGGKAVGLARLIAAGLPVPEGFVIDDRAFRHVAGEIRVGDLADIGHVLEAAADRVASVEVPAELERDVRERARALGDTLVVRSSASIEDGAGGAAAGVFRSTPESAEHVWAGIRGVWGSALTPLAALYARQTRAATIAIGVIVQRRIAGERVTVYTRPPGAPDGASVWIQRGEQLERRDRDDAEPIVQLALRAEAAIGAHGGADVELVVDGDALWVVQARAIIHPVTQPQTPPPPVILAPLVADGRVWTWDASHNPVPLSVAQAGLVERVDRAGIAPWSLRVCGGYLYSAPAGDPGPAIAAPSTVAELEARVVALEGELARALGDDRPALAVALERYLAFYRIWATELAPLIAAASRAHDPAALARQRPSRVRVILEAAGATPPRLTEHDVFAALGFMSPAWDVAVPTFAETPQVIREAIARAAAFTGRATAPVPAEPDALQRATADLAERDDAWFYRAQRMVRGALLDRAAELGIASEDVCWLPLDDLVAAAPIDPIDAKRRAAGARAAAERAARWAMPATINGPARTERPSLHGIGIGPRITGRVVRFDLWGSLMVGPGDVVVCQTVTPALAVLVIGCAALVSESRHDGLLDHGVALARELGITCVVGCRDAWSRLGNGTIVTVDGDAGTVEIV